MRRRTDLHDHCLVADALLRVDRPEVLDDLEAAVPGLRDVHVQAGVMLTLDHCRRTAEAIFERPDRPCNSGQDRDDAEEGDCARGVPRRTKIGPARLRLMPRSGAMCAGRQVSCRVYLK